MKTSEVHNTYNITETARRLRELRALQNLKQGEAASRLGIERKSLSAIECGEKGCSIDLFIRMSEIYEVSLDYLVLGKDTLTDNPRKALTNVIRQLEQLRKTL